MHSLSDLDKLIREQISRGGLVGVGLVLIQEGQIVHAAGYGTTNRVESGAPITPQTLFAFGSVSKTICATLIMRLVEQDLLDLDEPVLSYLPGFQFHNMAYGRQITLRHLLSHTSGLPAGGRSWGPRGRNALKRAVWDEIPHYQPLAPPGRFHQYASTVICMAGHIAEAVTGRYYDDLVSEYVFQPLGMARSTFDLAEAITHPIALPHQRAEDGSVQIRRRITSNEAGHPSSFCNGATQDLAQLALMLLNGGQHQGRPFLSAASVAEMQRPHCDRHVAHAPHPFWQMNTGYGLGLQTGRYKGERMARHGGITPGYQTFFDLFPGRQCGVVMQMTYLKHEAVTETVLAAWDTVLEVPWEGVVYTPPPGSATNTGRENQTLYTGTYLHVDSGRLATIQTNEDALTLDLNGRTQRLNRVAAREYIAVESPTRIIPVYFLPGEQEPVQDVLIYGDPFQRIQIEPDLKPDPAFGEKFSGTYRDPFNLDPAEQLVVQVIDNEPVIYEGPERLDLTPLSPTSLATNIGLMEFFMVDTEPYLQLGRAARYFRASI